MAPVCGRYASVSGRPELLDTFDAEDATEGRPLPPAYNIAPTDDVPAVLARHARRELRVLRWGLVPSWARDARGGARLINARVETLATKPAFRSALARRRCLLPAAGWYEWQGAEPAPGTRRVRKQPSFLSRVDGGLVVMAGLYEVWSDPAAPDARMWTCTIITGDALDELGRVHDRSPRLVRPRDWSAWLDAGTTDPAAVLGLLHAGEPGEIEARPVSTAVNDVRAEGPALLDPLTSGQVLPLLDVPDGLG